MYEWILLINNIRSRLFWSWLKVTQFASNNKFLALGNYSPKDKASCPKSPVSSTNPWLYQRGSLCPVRSQKSLRSVTRNPERCKLQTYLTYKWPICNFPASKTNCRTVTWKSTTLQGIRLSYLCFTHERHFINRGRFYIGHIRYNRHIK